MTAQEPLHPFDVLEFPGYTSPRLLLVTAVCYGCVNGENVIECIPIDRKDDPSAPLRIPLELIDAARRAGILSISRTETE